MALDDVKEVIENLQSIINTHHDYLFKKEARTRLVLINPLLQALGWEVSNPAAVQIEYQVKTKRADYVLIRERRDVPIAVIEAKGLGNTLEDDETAQAHIYANQAGIDYMIVTDGDTWKMFKAYGRGVLEDRQIMEFQLSKDLAHECMLQALRIWKSNLASGSPKEAMTPVLDSPDDKMKIDPAVPPAPASPIKKDDNVPVKQLYLEYWTALKSSFEERNNGIKFRKPQPQSWMGFKVGRSGFYLYTSASRNKRYISVGLTVRGVHGKSHFDRLKRSKTEIEKEISAKLKWEENPKENYIYLNCWDIDLQDRNDWDRQHKWLCEQLETFHSVFVPRIKALPK